MNKNFVVVSSDPALSHALDRRVFHEFFQLAAKAVASKGISIALPFPLPV